jgi:hypothetical protein
MRRIFYPNSIARRKHAGIDKCNQMLHLRCDRPIYINIADARKPMIPIGTNRKIIKIPKPGVHGPPGSYWCKIKATIT